MVCIAIDRPAEREVACARAGDSLEAETGAQQLLAEVAWRDVIRIQHDLAHHEPTARPEYLTEVAERGRLIGDLTEHADEIRAVERPIGVR